MKHISPASEAELERAGFDPIEGSSLRYPADEYLRQYEIEIVKSCIALNSTVSLPLAVSADHICAVVIVNFLRWFPRSRAIFCCNSLEAAEIFCERSVAVGIAAEEISTIDTFQTFKKISTHKVGRVILTTPQAFEKIVESGSTVVEDIRCVVFCLDASENLRFTKYKNIVGSLTVKGILFRVILVTPSVPSMSRKIGPLRKRQQLITSLLISQWIEPPASDSSFRKDSVPLGLSTEYCGNIEVLSETRSFIEKWLERSTNYLEKLHAFIPLPSTRPEHLFTLDWGQIALKAKSSTDETIQLVVNCMFLVEAARNLIINGPRVYLLYCIDLFGKAEKDSRAGNIQLMILSDTLLSKIYQTIQAKYSYNMASPVRCLILCENEFVSKAVCESISDTPKMLSAIVRVVPHPEPPSTVRCLILCENEFVSKAVCESISDTPKMLSAIVRVVPHPEPRHGGQHVAILSDEHEKLRPTDGRILKTTDELSCRRSSLFGGSGMSAIDRPTDGRILKTTDELSCRRSSLFGGSGMSAIDRYNFSFEFSRLQLASSEMQLSQYLPHLGHVAGDGGAVEWQVTKINSAISQLPTY
ncbi:unnamed protein product [Strongylus vulgaris]|uniref:Helicase ATP-binding domain-containing protein n=1 Tax=Strongylus vulgaris TaxID=40348 RepID=A0A3P7LCG1_STRVU|nr:unnamed protein product [Strongylus vulgaris]